MPNYQTKLRKILRKAKQPHIGWLDVFPAVIGKADGTVLTGTPGEIYVRNVLNGQPFTVHNTIAPNRANIQVEVGRRVDLLSLWQVKSVLQTFDQPAGGGYIQYHKEQHIFPASDAPFFPRKQIREFTVLVADSENFIVQVYGGQFRSLTGNKLIEHEQIDLSSYIPDAGAIYVNIETDAEGVLSVHEGTAFGAPAIATAGDIPVPETGYRRVATIILYESMPALLDEHILIPMPLEADFGGLGTGTQIHEAEEDIPLDDDEFGFWDVVDEVLKKITWANIVLTLTAIFDTLYAAITHTHDDTTITAQYRQFVYEVVGDDVDILTEDGEAIFELENLE